MSATDPTVVLGTIGSDAHAVGITLLDHALREAGFTVHNLGAQTAKTEFAAAAADHDADAVLVSSLYGHAQQDCAGLHDQLAAAGVDATTVVGGNLAVGQTDFETVKQRFEEMGFDRVFSAQTGFEAVVDAVKTELDVDERSPTTTTLGA
ncbi:MULTISPECIES: methylaspartate mutase subunit S [Halobacterium]|uniref:methylaspartate mutase subunit S n=1 Tax=Halobacterium TaxID=2239 RepID=UPI0019659C1A|nr:MULTISPECIES: methylaspartate mutase subunit S [Halobacterium]MCF2164424.1 methylaspartate mutase subunit S [Halobacterium salinarum]MCF2167211.1 methylaspartate mutase subunit S [Halobacterium salinarum]MCF2207229.1 methylaspartate mutase subunit S [Halobacterium salinarum]MCF2238475.1 methylaspartate mutase subunit S [Halobacterium salinarum]MCF2242030.1 methylaspartate mutase subunit S [Halobacterium salinarum]